MKPAPFSYLRPTSVAEAFDALKQHGDDAKILAGGQSLVPLMNLRLARPEVLIDINGLDSLAGVDDDQGFIRIGALTRQSHVEHHPTITNRLPLLPAALASVAHPPIRNRGTIGGSAAHADPSAELPVVLTTLESTFVLRDGDGERCVAAEEFFISYLTTALSDTELLVRIDVPVPVTGTGVAFREFSRRHGDYALGGAAVLVTGNENGLCTAARIGLLGASAVPLRAREAEEMLTDQRITPELARHAAAVAVEGIEPLGNMHGTPAYRVRVIEAMCERAVLAAAEASGKL